MDLNTRVFQVGHASGEHDMTPSLEVRHRGNETIRCDLNRVYLDEHLTRLQPSDGSNEIRKKLIHGAYFIHR